MINLKVYDVIDRLNKKHILFDILRSKKRYDIERYDRVLNKEHCYKKPHRKCAPKANSRPLFNFGK